MKKLRNILLIAGTAILALGVLANYLPFIDITEFAYGFCWGFSGTLIIVGLVLLASPLYCRKKKDETPAEPKK